MQTLKATDTIFNRVLFKADFWNRYAKTIMNERQEKLLK